MGVRITRAFTQDELYKLYTYISQKAAGLEETLVQPGIKKLAWNIFSNEVPLPIFRRSFCEFWKIEGRHEEEIVDQPIYFSIDKSFSYVEKQEPIVLSFTNHAIYEKKPLRCKPTLMTTFRSFLKLIDPNKFTVIFGAGADTPIPSTDSFEKAVDSKDKKRIRWTYLDFAVKFFSPVFHGGQVLSSWLQNTKAKIVTTNWSRSVERELVRERKGASETMKKQIDSCLKRIISYYSNSIAPDTSKEIRITLGSSKSPTKDRADKIISQADGLLIVGSSLEDENLISWVDRYKERKKFEDIKIAMIIHEDREFEINPPWVKFLEECDNLLCTPITTTLIGS